MITRGSERQLVAVGTYFEGLQNAVGVKLLYVAEQVTGHFDHHFVNNSPLVRSLDISSTDFLLLTEDRVGFVEKNRVLQQGEVNAL